MLWCVAQAALILVPIEPQKQDLQSTTNSTRCSRSCRTWATHRLVVEGEMQRLGGRFWGPAGRNCGILCCARLNRGAPNTAYMLCSCWRFYARSGTLDDLERVILASFWYPRPPILIPKNVLKTQRAQVTRHSGHQ